MKNLYEILIEQGNIWAVLIMAALFIIIAVAQKGHENSKKWARPVQYGTGLIIIILFIWLVKTVSG